MKATFVALLAGLLIAGCTTPLPTFPTDFKSLKALAEKGDARAQKELGLKYAKGAGVQQDFEEARFLARPEESDLLIRGVQAEQSLAAPSGQFSVAGGRGGRLVQPGRKGPGVRY